MMRQSNNFLRVIKRTHNRRWRHIKEITVRAMPLSSMYFSGASSASSRYSCVDDKARPTRAIAGSRFGNSTSQPRKATAKDIRIPAHCTGKSRTFAGPAAPRSKSPLMAQPTNASEADDISIDELIEVANELADAAATITVPYFRTRVVVDVKADSSPVTIADKQAEETMRKIIEARFPEHTIYGEEAGITVGATGSEGSRYCWVLDPIDGTKSFITGKPLFGTLIALLRDGAPIVGIIDQPVLKERWLGAKGRQSTLNGSPISSRECPVLGSAYMYCTTPHMFEGESEKAFNRVRDEVRIPMYGCDCYAYGLLAAGHCDLVVEADLKPYDYMALVPVIEGAGGRITDWEGSPLELEIDPATGETRSKPAGEVVAAGDAQCHEQALAALAWNK